MTTITSRALLIALLAVLTASFCQAQGMTESIQSNTVRVGLYDVFYHATAQDISGPYVPSGVNLEVKNVQTLYLAYVRRLSERLDLELAIGNPPTTKTYGKGPATLGSVPYDGQEISSAKWLAPTLLLNYKFFDESYALRPYIGIGLNYVTFYDRRSTAAGDAASGGPTRISLTSSLGPSEVAGLSYRMSKDWSLFASYSFSRVRSKLTADTAGLIRTTEISFAPQTLVLSVGHSF